MSAKACIQKLARVVLRDGTDLDLMACGACTLSGYRADGRKEGYAASEVKRVVILAPEEACP